MNVLYRLHRASIICNPTLTLPSRLSFVSGDTENVLITEIKIKKRESGINNNSTRSRSTAMGVQTQTTICKQNLEINTNDGNLSNVINDISYYRNSTIIINIFSVRIYIGLYINYISYYICVNVYIILIN